MAASRIYLDNAATSYPKPPAVWDAVDEYQRTLGAAVGRGSSRAAAQVQARVDRARRRASELFGAADPSHVVFTFNGTDSLNLALKGLLVPGDHVVTTSLEHNSVLRPLRALHDRSGVDVSIVSPNAQGRIEPTEIGHALQQNTRLVAVTHASNVTGILQPVAEIGAVARNAGALLLVDAAQTAGHLPVRLDDLNADLIACSGHKGLLGPLGTGLLILARGLEPHLRAIREGGTGSRSEDNQQPESLPDKYESGNHNAPGLVGLDAALGFLHEQGLEALRRHEIERTAQLLEGLRSIPGITIYGTSRAEERTSVVSLTFDLLPPHEAALLLDEHFGIETRAGLHCAPGAHRELDTLDNGGTLRLSPGPFTTSAEIDAVLNALRALASG